MPRPRGLYNSTWTHTAASYHGRDRPCKTSLLFRHQTWSCVQRPRWRRRAVKFWTWLMSLVWRRTLRLSEPWTFLPPLFYITKMRNEAGTEVGSVSWREAPPSIHVCSSPSIPCLFASVDDAVWPHVVQVSFLQHDKSNWFHYLIFNLHFMV
jgi:hypothetical protein